MKERTSHRQLHCLLRVRAAPLQHLLEVVKAALRWRPRRDGDSKPAHNDIRASPRRDGRLYSSAKRSRPNPSSELSFSLACFSLVTPMNPSSLRNAVKRKTHKERAQPCVSTTLGDPPATEAVRRSERTRFGLLEKHKDYKLRAKDFHRKEDAIKVSWLGFPGGAADGALPLSRCCGTKRLCATRTSSTLLWRKPARRMACTWQGKC